MIQYTQMPDFNKRNIICIVAIFQIYGTLGQILVSQWQLLT
jgi:hypothetical protein